MLKKIKIPKNILELYSSCLKSDKSFNSRLFAKRLKESNQVSSWFSKASDLYSIEVSPQLVYYTSIKAGLDYYTPAICKNCGKILTLAQAKSKSYCSRKCAASSKEVRQKTEATIKEKYGVSHALQSDAVKNKFKNTCLSKYGVENPYASSSIKRKIAKINLARYGVENASKSSLVKEKRTTTNIERYGCSNPAQSAQVKKKTATTNTERYGSASPLSNAGIKAKSRQTVIKNYGVDNVAKSNAVKEKIKATNLSRYGYTSASKNEIISNKAKIALRQHYYESFVNALKSKGITLLSNKEDYIADRQLTLKCSCGYTWVNESAYGNNYQHIFCKKCASNYRTSLVEKELVDYIKSIYFGNIIENSRDVLTNNRELDIYLPEKKLAFEFDGTYYHSELFKDNKYHQKKTLECRKQGIRLIHVFEHEWHSKKEKIKSLIRSALGIYSTRIYARRCTVKDIDNTSYRDFLVKYHLQSAVSSSTKLGLFYKDELVAVAGWGKSRFKQGEIELYRYCVKADYQIVGGFTKLIAASKIDKFISYIDLAHYSGQGYEASGFSKVAYTAPSYVYCKGLLSLNRMACQKHKLQAMLKEKYDEQLTEQENMRNAGWLKVYDAGNLKVEYNTIKA